MEFEIQKRVAKTVVSGYVSKAKKAFADSDDSEDENKKSLLKKQKQDEKERKNSSKDDPKLEK
jgi:hypothetical protein